MTHLRYWTTCWNADITIRHFPLLIFSLQLNGRVKQPTDIFVQVVQSIKFTCAKSNIFILGFIILFCVCDWSLERIVSDCSHMHSVGETSGWGEHSGVLIFTARFRYTHAGSSELPGNCDVSSCDTTVQSVYHSPAGLQSREKIRRKKETAASKNVKIRPWRILDCRERRAYPR